MKGKFLTLIGTALILGLTSTLAVAESDKQPGEIKLSPEGMKILCERFPLNSRCAGNANSAPKAPAPEAPAPEASPAPEAPAPEASPAPESPAPNNMTPAPEAPAPEAPAPEATPAPEAPAPKTAK